MSDVQNKWDGNTHIVIAKSPGNHFKEHITRVWHERDAAIFSALRLVALLVVYSNDRVCPLLWSLSLAPDEGGNAVVLKSDGPVWLRSEFQQSHGKAVRPHCFRFWPCLHRCGNVLLRGLDPEGTRDRLLRLLGKSGSSMSDFAFSSERKNDTHLSRIHPLSCSSFPSSPRTYCDSTFVSSSCIDLASWKNSCRSPLRNCFSNSTTCRSKKLTTAALYSASDMHVWCPFSGAAILRKSHQSQPATQLPFRRFHFNLALVSFAPRGGSPIQRSAWRPRRMRARRPYCYLVAGLPWGAFRPLWPPTIEAGEVEDQSSGTCGQLMAWQRSSTGGFEQNSRWAWRGRTQFCGPNGKEGKNAGGGHRNVPLEFAITLSL